VDESLDLIVKCGHWRRTNDIDHLIAKIESSAALNIRFAKAYLPMGVIGHDAVGRPVNLNRMSMIDFPRVLADNGLDKAVEYAIYCNEKLLENNPTCEAIILIDLGLDANPPQTSLLDVRAWIGALLAFLKPFASVADPFYPEMFHKIFFTRAPAIFQAVWKIAKTFIAEATVEKIEILGERESKTRLLHFMPLSVVPHFLGGANELRHLGVGGKLKKGDAQDEAFIARLEAGLGNNNSPRVRADTNPENVQLQRRAALDVLRNAIAELGAVSDEAQKRGSWRFVPGLAWLESLDDDVLEKALNECDGNADAAALYLSQLAATKDAIKPLPVAPAPAPLQAKGCSLM